MSVCSTSTILTMQQRDDWDTLCRALATIKVAKCLDVGLSANPADKIIGLVLSYPQNSFCVTYPNRLNLSPLASIQTIAFEHKTVSQASTGRDIKTWNQSFE